MKPAVDVCKNLSSFFTATRKRVWFRDEHTGFWGVGAQTWARGSSHMHSPQKYLLQSKWVGGGVHPYGLLFMRTRLALNSQNTPSVGIKGMQPPCLTMHIPIIYAAYTSVLK